MSKTKNPFDKFAINNKVEFIKALDAEVTYRPLTKAEADKFNARLIGDYKGKGEMEVDLIEANKINMEKVALCLVDPKLSLADIKGYGDGINEAINEIVALIDGRTEDETDPEGN